MPPIPSLDEQRVFFDRARRQLDLVKAAGVVPDSGRAGGHCLLLALFGWSDLIEAGYQCLLQAGDCCWPIRTAENDDGISATHFSYMWDPESPRSAVRICEGRLPEIHVWIGMRQVIKDKVREPTVLVDFSTGALKEEAELAGLSWKAPDPPEWLWASELPAGVMYRARMTSLAFLLPWLEGREELMELLRLSRPSVHGMLVSQIRIMKEYLAACSMHGVSVYEPPPLDGTAPGG